MSSLEKFIANEIIAYHHETHGELGMSPAQAWEQAWMTPEGLQSPCFPRDEREFLISFLPGESRVVSREGIAWNGLQYRCPELEPFIQREKRQFFRFDPRDISRIYFDTGEGPFLDVPWTEVNYPRLSRWEWNELRATLRTPRRPADGRIVHLARESNRELNRRLQSRSQRARRRLAREDGWTQPLPEAEPRAPLAVTVASSSGPLEFEILE